jgi:phosphoribosylanthranilate isomerase
MSLFVKICGVTDVAAAEAAVAAGVQAIGFVFAVSPRRVSVAQARRISGVVPPGVARVAVFRRPTPVEVMRIVDEFEPDIVQADHDTLGDIDGVGMLPVYREGSEVESEQGRFLYEGPVSGVGHQVDLTRAARMALHGEMILAGGLRGDNVDEAVTTVRPFGVDVSSGVESSPGVKSPDMIRSFVATARMAEERLVST